MANHKELALETASVLLTAIKDEVAEVDKRVGDLNPHGAELLRLAEAYALVTEHSNRVAAGNTVHNGYRGGSS